MILAIWFLHMCIIQQEYLIFQLCMENWLSILSRRICAIHLWIRVFRLIQWFICKIFKNISYILLLKSYSNISLVEPNTEIVFWELSELAQNVSIWRISPLVISRKPKIRGFYTEFCQIYVRPTNLKVVVPYSILQ